jgi:peptide/nickel transport system permease protein
MKRYAATGHSKEFRVVSFLKKAEGVDVLSIGYGLCIVLLVAVSYLLGLCNLLPHDPEAVNIEGMMAPPGTGGHLLGTDFLGRDVLARLIVGIQAYFLPGLLAVFLAVVAGAGLGVIAGYWEGSIDRIVTFFTDLIDSFPRMVLLLLVIAALKPDIYVIMAVVGITNVPAVAAVIRSRTRLLKEKNFIEAARALGLPAQTIIFKHILWFNCRSLLVIQATLGMGEAILMETSLSYLGFGVQEPSPSWGNMVQSGSNYLLRGMFWPSAAPALAILFTILGFHLLGDGLNSLEARKYR